MSMPHLTFLRESLALLTTVVLAAEHFFTIVRHLTACAGAHA